MSESGDWPGRLRSAWAVLRANRPEAIEALAVGKPVNGHPVRVGVDGLGRRHLLVPLTDEDGAFGDRRDGSLSIRSSRMTFASLGPADYLDVVCERADLFDIFDALLVRTLTTLEESEGDPAVRALKEIERWQELLQVGRRRVLSIQEQTGLIAELMVLEEVFSGAPVDVGVWRGPRGEPHDILLPTCALEVKAANPSSVSVEIHGIDQLAAPSGRPLALVVVTLGALAEGVSLPEVVARVRRHVEDVAAFDELLAGIGYHVADAAKYAATYEMTSVAVYPIDARSPRIVSSSFSEGAVLTGIGQVVYSIDLASFPALPTTGASAVTHWVMATR